MIGESLLNGEHYRSSYHGCTLFSADVQKLEILSADRGILKLQASSAIFGYFQLSIELNKVCHGNLKDEFVIETKSIIDYEKQIISSNY